MTTIIILCICRKREVIKGFKNVLRTKTAFADLLKECYVSFCTHYCENMQKNTK